LRGKLLPNRWMIATPARRASHAFSQILSSNPARAGCREIRRHGMVKRSKSTPDTARILRRAGATSRNFAVSKKVLLRY